VRKALGSIGTSNREAELLLAAFSLPYRRSLPSMKGLLGSLPGEMPWEGYEVAVNPTHLSDTTQDKNSSPDTSRTGHISREKSGTADSLPYFT